MGTEAETLPVGPGDVVAGKYAIVRLLGRGGMGSVFEARHRALGQRVAIKMLHSQSSGHEEAVERFLREARAAASLTSDHVVRVYDVGIHESGLPFMVMELLEGMDLGELLERRGAVSIFEAVRWVLQAASAVAEAHEAGIVHRDLKPSNLFLVRPTSANRTAKVKVVDFGISKQGNLPEGSVQTLTGPRSVMGSPAYMSPEQVRSTKSVDARSDVWSLGVILYELLSGRTAFDGESLGDVFVKIREEPLPSIRTIVPTVPPALDAVISRCLERERVRRYADAAELADALRAIPLEGIVDEPTPPPSEPFRSRVSQSTTAFDLISPSPPGTSGAQSTSKPSSSTHAPWISVRTSNKRSRITLVAAAFAVSTGLLVVAALLVRGNDPPSIAAPAAPVAEVDVRRVHAEADSEKLGAEKLGAEKTAPAVTPNPSESVASPTPSASSPRTVRTPRLVVPVPPPLGKPSGTAPKPPTPHPSGNSGDELGI